MTDAPSTITSLLRELLNIRKYVRRLMQRVWLTFLAFLMLVSLSLYHAGYLLDLLNIAAYVAFVLTGTLIAWRIIPYLELHRWRHLLARLIQTIKNWLQEKYSEQEEYRALVFEEMEPEELLGFAEDSELANLAKILGVETESPKKLANVLRGKAKGLMDKVAFRSITYGDVLDRVKEGIVQNNELPDPATYLDSERAIWTNILEQLPEDKQEEIKKQVMDKAGKKGVSIGKEVATGGLMMLAQMGGFTTYIMASTALSAVTGAVGITLPFAAYTTVSSAISVAIGPVGWTALGAWLLYKYNKPNYQQLIPAVVLIASIRERMVQERDSLLASLQSKIEQGEQLLHRCEQALDMSPTEGLRVLPSPAIAGLLEHQDL